MAYHWDFTTVLLPPEFWIKGALLTLVYAVATTVAGSLIGLVLGPALLSKRRIVRLPVLAYVQLFRCTPLLVQVVWFYYALPIVLGIDLPAWFAAGIGLSLYMGAFTTEIFRAGVLAVEPRAVAGRAGRRAVAAAGAAPGHPAAGRTAHGAAVGQPGRVCKRRTRPCSPLSPYRS